MSDKYKIIDINRAYFVTLTVVGWIDVFTRKNHKLLVIDSLKHCQHNKGLVIYGWCLMSSHLHMIIKAGGKDTLPDILRDFKKFTSKKIVEQIKDEPESRREWMLSYFENVGKDLNRISNYKFWQDGNQAKEIQSNDFFYEKLNYIHKNPVEEMIIERPEDYWFSFARNYAELNYLLDVEMVTPQLITVK